MQRKLITDTGLRFLKRYAVNPEVLEDTLGRLLTICPSWEFLNNIRLEISKALESRVAVTFLDNTNKYATEALKWK